MTQMRCVGVVEPAPGASNITDVINDVISRPILPNGSPGQGDCCVLSQAKPNISSLLSLTDSGQSSQTVACMFLISCLATSIFVGWAGV